jgi:hypothetical protein
VYVCGGYDGDAALATCERFDPAGISSSYSGGGGGGGGGDGNGGGFGGGGSGEWSPLPPMPAAKNGAAACVLGAYLYCIGGYDGEEISRRVFRFDFSAGEWSEVAAMRRRRHSTTAVVFNGCIYVLGGIKGKEVGTIMLARYQTLALYYFLRFLSYGCIYTVGGIKKTR